MKQTEKYRQLIEIAEPIQLEYAGTSRLALCPTLGGRIFAEVCGIMSHRVDIESVANPSNKEFNNYGGGNLWLAPEGGEFGWNYRGDTWYVQEGINIRPFEVISRDESSATIKKTITLTNRAERSAEVSVKRELQLSNLPDILSGYNLQGFVSYVTEDTFEVISKTLMEEALIAAWTLEQFDATEDRYLSV